MSGGGGGGGGCGVNMRNWTARRVGNSYGRSGRGVVVSATICGVARGGVLASAVAVALAVVIGDVDTRPMRTRRLRCTARNDDDDDAGRMDGPHDATRVVPRVRTVQGP